MRFFIIETQVRPDGDVNFIKTEKYTKASAQSYYYTRKAAYLVDTTYVSAGTLLIDQESRVYERDNITTQYVAPTTTETEDNETTE